MTKFTYLIGEKQWQPLKFDFVCQFFQAKESFDMYFAMKTKTVLKNKFSAAIVSGAITLSLSNNAVDNVVCCIFF